MRTLKSHAPRAITAALLVASSALPGCYIYGTTRGGVYVPQQQVQVAQPAYVQPAGGGVAVNAQASIPAGVVQLQVNCAQGAPEQCNGVDDNCNGAIDEGCGYQTGQIQVTAAWSTASDIDLHVTDPNGEEVYYGHRQSASGGQLDRDANAACNNSPPTVENVFWSSPQPPRGTYYARVHAYAMCNAFQTPVTLSIAVGGRIIGTYQYTLTQQGTDFTIPFTIQ